MAWRLSQFRDALREELGDQLYEAIGDGPFDRWVNAGQRKLGSYAEKKQTIAWAAGDTAVLLPADFHHSERFVPTPGSVSLPDGDYWGSKYEFTDPARQAGSGSLYYYANRPTITGSVNSTLTDEGDEALLSYALYRLFKRLSSSRADYRMYATIAQGNGVDIAELEGVSERHLQDFRDAGESLAPLRASSYFAD